MRELSLRSHVKPADTVVSLMDPPSPCRPLYASEGEATLTRDWSGCANAPISRLMSRWHVCPLVMLRHAPGVTLDWHRSDWHRLELREGTKLRHGLVCCSSAHVLGFQPVSESAERFPMSLWAEDWLGRRSVILACLGWLRPSALRPRSLKSSQVPKRGAWLLA